MKKYLFVTAFAVSTLLSCKKEECPVPVPPADLSATAWSGPSTVNSINYTMTFTLAADGTLTGGFNVPTYPFTGTWNKTPNSNDIRIFFVQAGNSWKGTGVHNSTTNKIESGTLTQLTGGSFTGTFNVTKQ